MKLSLLRPVPKQFPISSPFGNRVLNGKIDFHSGVDFAVPVGTPVKCPIEGIVVRAGWENPFDPKQGYGLRVMMSVRIDGLAYFVWCGHLNDVLVEAGDQVGVGQVIGKSGNTGKSTGPHLHVGARRADTKDFYDIDFFDTPTQAVA